MTDAFEFEPHRARRFRKRAEILAFASNDAITYHKSWGTQDLPEGGWVAVALDEDGHPTGEIYGIDAAAFEDTYVRSESGIPNRYTKSATIEAYQVGREFVVSTKLDDGTGRGTKRVEVESNRASATAMVVRNPGGELYTLEKEEFDRMYVEADTGQRASSLDDHLDPDLGPKRILSLDGGGARSVLTLGTLERLEQRLRARHDDPELRLCDYFDLIAGTSTGAIIAAALACGQSVGDVLKWFHPLAPNIFGRRGLPFVRPTHDAASLDAALASVFSDAKLGGDGVQTGLLVVAKKLDEPGVMPIATNPRHPAWRLDDDRPGHAEYLLRQIVRASAASPFPMQPDAVGLYPRANGEVKFINGGLSPHNNPALQALILATHRAGLMWPVGTEDLLLVSVGAGWSRSQHELRGLSVSPAVRSLHGMLNDSAEQVEIVLQTLSEAPQASLLSYRRYDATLDAELLADELDVKFSEDAVERMRPLDIRDRKTVEGLLEIGRKLGDQRITQENLPAAFDLPAA